MSAHERVKIVHESKAGDHLARKDGERQGKVKARRPPVKKPTGKKSSVDPETFIERKP